MRKCKGCNKNLPILKYRDLYCRECKDIKWVHKQKIRDIHKIVNVAIKERNLIKSTLCEVCDTKEYLEGHHADYNYPLDVIWACRPCHCKMYKYCLVLNG